MNLQHPAGLPLDAPDPSVLLGAVAGVVFFSLLMAVTRVRALAVVWRLCAIACAVAPAVLAWSWWNVNDPTGTLTTDRQGTLEPLLGHLPALPRLPDLGQVRAPEGLEVMALVWAVGLVAFLLLVVRTSRSPR